MFGVEYLENPLREKFDFFSKKIFMFHISTCRKIGVVTQLISEKKNHLDPYACCNRRRTKEDIA